ncbi:hypothetical protein [Hyphomicrobium sp. DMF-1]|jgi:hypothetical protein|uniref:hypothetical protein n=1 Tax=Hyphomicrobium sp. DMF-1 TaxID=3019544 RepID=UPI0022EBBBC1|nr:hypothetical protein [Hyphomicrobium sp. DMF-1]WBT36507.1 hypothetical protein PE058_12665 [Hyphomicrobium sp. DMF-1]
MLKYDASAFCRISSVLGQALVILRHSKDPDWGSLAATLGELQREADRMGMASVVKVLLRIKEHMFETPGASSASVQPMLSELYNRLRDELEEMLFLQVEAAQAPFYSQSNPLFGAVVAEQFPSVTYEVEEAGRCLALERSTASAFHSIRCLEAGIRAIARSLGISDPTRGAERSWGSTLKAIKAEIDRRWPANTGRMGGDARFFDEVYGALAGMQNPYRNATMHLDDKYTGEEARHLMELVRGIMGMLANRMNERGQPQA